MYVCMNIKCVYIYVCVCDLRALFYCSFSWRIQISHLQQHLRTTVKHHNKFLVYIYTYMYILGVVIYTHTHTHIYIYIYTDAIYIRLPL